MKKPYKLIRVTSVLSFVESQWKEYWWRSVGFEAADKVSKESAEFGTRVHKIVEEYLQNPDMDVAKSPELDCAVRIVHHIDSNKITPLFETWEKSLEIEVKDEKLGLIGHFDMAALVDGQPCIVDFKTSNKMRKSFPLQKAMYAKMANKQFGVTINRGLTIRSHWNKETQAVEFEVKYYDGLIKKYWPIAKKALDIYKYFTRA